MVGKDPLDLEDDDEPTDLRDELDEDDELEDPVRILDEEDDELK
jgi:hypothetical protein